MEELEAIVTLTMNPAVDRSMHVPYMTPYAKMRGSAPSAQPGGGGLNVSRVVRTLGGTSLALYTSGGAMGLLLYELLERDQIEHLPIPVTGTTRESVTVTDDSTGLYYRYLMPGPALDEVECQRSLEEISSVLDGAEYLVVSGSLPAGVPDSFYAELVRVARDANIRVILDAAGEPLRQALDEGGVYLVKPNMRELSGILRRPIRDGRDQEAAARELVRAQRAAVVVVSMGLAGVLMVTESSSERIPSPVVPLACKIGAGDSMIGALVLALAQGESLRSAVLWGVAAGASAAMNPGTELCRRADTERLYDLMAENEA